MLKAKAMFLFVSFLNKLLPKSKGKVFFFDRGFISFNEIEMIKWIEKQRPDHKNKIVFFTNCRALAKKYFSSCVLVESSSIRGLYHQLTSEYVFVEQNGHRWVCKPARNQIIIQLWHGTPIKKVGNLNNKLNWYKYNDVYSKVLATSDFAWEIMKKCYGYTDDKRIICPYPRCDAIADGLSIEQEKNIIGDNYDKVVLWLPTFRKAYYEDTKQLQKEFPILDENSIRELNSFLQERRILLIVKLHPLQKMIPLFTIKCSNIRFMYNAELSKLGITIYNLIGRSDCLISDYSSVIFDYLLHNKPILFTASDYEQYKLHRGFIDENYFQDLPGVFVKTINELITSLDEELRLDNYREQREKLARKMNKTINNSFCETIFRLVGIIND